MKQRITELSLFKVCVLFVISVFFSSCDNALIIGPEESGTFDADSDKRKWLFMVYMSGDNELESNLIEDINEMESIGFEDESVDIIVLADRSPGYDSSNGNWEDTRLYLIKPDSAGYNINIISQRVSGSELGITADGEMELNMGNPSTLSSFITFCRNGYPAENYVLILWGQGTGWRTGAINPQTPETAKRAVVFDDSSSGDPLYTSEVKDGLENSDIEIILFDLCLGGMLETAYEIRNAASVMIASEELMGSDGMEYDDFFGRLSGLSLSNSVIASSAVSSYASSYSNTAGSTMSAVDLTKIDTVMHSLNTFSDTLLEACSTPEIVEEVKNLLFTYAESFFRTPGDMNIDIYDMAEKISLHTDYADESADNLKTAISNAVLFNWTNPSGNPDAKGLSVHFIPLNSSGQPIVHDTGYIQGEVAENQLSFVLHSSWVPAADGGGLLGKLWYQE